MSNDITTLAAKLKASAYQSALARKCAVGMEVAAESFDFIELSTPANILALVEALEAAEHKAAVDWEAAASLNVENEELRRRIVELSEETKGYKDAYKEESHNKDIQLSELNNALCKLLPGTQYMDPPDGGSVTPLEQVSRMVEDYRQRIEGITQNPVAWQLVDVITSEVFVYRDLDKVNASLKENQWLEVNNLYDHPAKLLTVKLPRSFNREIFGDGMYEVPNGNWMHRKDVKEALESSCADAGIKLQIEE